MAVEEVVCAFSALTDGTVIVELVFAVAITEAAADRLATREDVDVIAMLWFIFISRTAFNTSAVQGVLLPSCLIDASRN
jgi:hypothetical protein